MNPRETGSAHHAGGEDSPVRDRSVGDEYLGVESFRSSLVRVVVLMSVLVLVVAGLLVARLAGHIAREHESAVVAQWLVEGAVRTEPGAPEQVGALREAGRGTEHTRALADGSTLTWGYSAGQGGRVWALHKRDGVVHGAIVAPAATMSRSTLFGVFVRVIVGGGILAWMTYWAGITLVNRAVERLSESARWLHRVATRDVVTALPNRFEFETRLRRGVARHRGWVMVLDLDNFKDVNDNLGHEYGDRYLSEVARRARQAVPPRGSVARLGGDEFAVWLPSASRTEAMQTASDIVDAIGRPCTIDGITVSSGASIGLAEAGADDDHSVSRDGVDHVTELMSRADIAMYVSKREQAGPVLYDVRHDSNSIEVLSLRAELQEAIRERRIELHYQPKKCLQSGLWTGVEALARWRHPERGWVSPALFIDVAERTGLIHELTDLVLDRAAEQAAAFRSAGIACPIAVNLSALSLRQTQLTASIHRALERQDVPPSSFELELTESAALTDVKAAVEVLARLADAGFSLALDDFGTGMSSLSHLYQLPIHTLKIDRSFVLRMSGQASGADQRIVEATIGLAHSLGLRVVAEGVEEEAVEAVLRDIGCDIAQGYGIQRPVPHDEIVRLLMVHGVVPDRRTGTWG